MSRHTDRDRLLMALLTAAANNDETGMRLLVADLAAAELRALLTGLAQSVVLMLVGSLNRAGVPVPHDAIAATWRACILDHEHDGGAA